MKCQRDLFKKKKIKTMNIKIAKKSQLLTIESIKPHYANKQNRNRIIDMEVIWRDIVGRGRERRGKKVQGLRSTNW